MSLHCNRIYIGAAFGYFYAHNMPIITYKLRNRRRKTDTFQRLTHVNRHN